MSYTVVILDESDRVVDIRENMSIQEAENRVANIATPVENLDKNQGLLFPLE